MRLSLSSDRLIELKIANQRLKKEVENLENKILNLVGMVEIERSGGEGYENYINQKLMELIMASSSYLNVATPKIDNFYTNELINIAKKGVSITIIMNERSGVPPNYQQNYDKLKNTKNISIITNPNVRFLLVFNEKEALYAGGSLDRDELERSVLIVTKVKVQDKLKKIADIFNLMLPSFMRK